MTYNPIEDLIDCFVGFNSCVNSTNQDHVFRLFRSSSRIEA